MTEEQKPKPSFEERKAARFGDKTTGRVTSSAGAGLPAGISGGPIEAEKIWVTGNAKTQKDEGIERAERIKDAIKASGIKTLDLDWTEQGIDIVRKPGADDDQFEKERARVIALFEDLNRAYSFSSTLQIQIKDKTHVIIPPTFEKGGFTAEAIRKALSTDPKEKMEFAVQMDLKRPGEGKKRWNEFRQSKEGSSGFFVRGAALGQVNFNEYDLHDIIFEHDPETRKKTVLSGAKFHGADIRGADFSAIPGLSEYDFTGSIRNQDTSFPDGMLEKIAAAEARAKQPRADLPKGGPSEPPPPKWGERRVAVLPDALNAAPIIAGPDDGRSGSAGSKAAESVPVPNRLVIQPPPEGTEEIGLEPLADAPTPPAAPKIEQKASPPPVPPAPAAPAKRPSLLERFGGQRPPADANRGVKKPGDGGSARGA